MERLQREGTEENWAKLWKTFFTAIAIEERKNPNCQRNHLPLRFRDLMTEFQ
jgi:probable DNA metabolism protein